MKRKILCLLTVLCLFLTMSGCSRNVGKEQITSPTLPPASVAWTAPDGDRVIREPGDYLYYLPEEDDFVLLTHENYKFYITDKK